MPPMTATDIGQVEAAAEAFREDYTRAKQQIQLAVVGHEEIIDGVLTCLFADGHALLEGAPQFSAIFDGWDLDVEIPDAHFVPVLAQDAMQIDFISSIQQGGR